MEGVGIPRDWSDRDGGSWSTSTQIGGSSDELSIWLGDIPEQVVRGVREFQANSIIMGSPDIDVGRWPCGMAVL